MKSILIIALFQSLIVFGQNEYQQNIQKCDSLLFQVGFNTCNLEQFNQLITSDFEFYHDKSGFSDRAKFLLDLQNGLCANPAEYQSIRKLNSKKSTFYPLYHNDTLYAVIQKGEHSFYEKIGNGPLTYASTALFEHLWVFENNQWLLKRAYSFDHHVKKKKLKGI